MNLHLWTITKELPKELADRFPQAVSHDGEYYWVVAAEDAAPTQLPEESQEDMTILLLKILASQGQVTVSKGQAQSMYSHPLHRVWAGQYETRGEFERDYADAKEVIERKSSERMPSIGLIQGTSARTALASRVGRINLTQEQGDDK